MPRIPVCSPRQPEKLASSVSPATYVAAGGAFSLRVGQTVVKGGQEYVVSEVDGNVVGLRHPHGSFAMYTSVDLVHVQLELDLAPAASLRPACSVTAPAGPVVGASRLQGDRFNYALGNLGKHWYRSERRA